MQIREICQEMEAWAPLAWQESYDNAGLLVGDANATAKGILISLDCTEEVLEEAIKKGCNLIISHHPIVFSGLKRFTGASYVERTVIKAIQNNIALYASHTNLDHAPKGVSYHLASKLGIQGQVMKPMQEALKALQYYVPASHEEAVREALHAAGAGNIGEYSSCSFTSEGKGRFQPSVDANPYTGIANELSEVNEVKVEMVFPSYLSSEILAALKSAHPYEEVAYFITSLDNSWQDVGAGYIGILEKPLAPEAFLHFVKERLGLDALKHTALPKGPISKVAVCGGAGSFLIKEAIRQKADAYITSDIKYHEFFDAENQCLLIDVGHYESEVMIIDAVHDYLSKKISNFAVLKSETNTNPVRFA
ncbi:Nif3-like dinuclear metal center hexameric protein [Aquirufa sp. 2-AUSEE-184A6]|uniref:GTP cyclohydrolase 1 type 2 homolog n=1 Tax=Aquirufa novilacunae TaxID=3139305 RepID=A0ABW8T093_9BACT